MCHVSYNIRVTCHMSYVTCHLSHVTCHMSQVTRHLIIKIDTLVELVDGGFIITGAYLV